jgi:hypothetical protein
MSNGSLTAGAASLGSSRAGFGSFSWMISAFLLFIVLSGFSRTLSLRPLFDVPAIPPYLYVHGIVLTSWFVLFFAQNSLVAMGKTAVHRQLGIAAATVGAFTPPAAVMATFGLPARIIARGDSLEDRIEFITSVVFLNLQGLLCFSVALIAGVLLRRRRDYHSRLMLWASLFIVGPAVARVSRWPIFDAIEEQPFTWLFFAVVGSIIVIHELISSKRLHPVTVAGIALTVLGQLFGQLMSGSTAAQDFVRSLV